MTKVGSKKTNPFIQDYWVYLTLARIESSGRELARGLATPYSSPLTISAKGLLIPLRKGSSSRVWRRAPPPAAPA